MRFLLWELYKHAPVGAPVFCCLCRPPEVWRQPHSGSRPALGWGHGWSCRPRSLRPTGTNRRSGSTTHRNHCGQEMTSLNAVIYRVDYGFITILWDEFIHPFPHFTVEFGEWISNFTLHFTYRFTYHLSMTRFKLNHVSKRCPSWAASGNKRAVSLSNIPFAQISQCTRSTSHNVPFYNRDVNVHAYFCYKWCIVGYFSDALWDLWEAKWPCAHNI